MTRAEAGRIGGIQTLLRHGREHFSLAGQRGGRPRARTIRQQSAPRIFTKGEAAQRPFSLKTLKELWDSKRGESCN